MDWSIGSLKTASGASGTEIEPSLVDFDPTADDDEDADQTLLQADTKEADAASAAGDTPRKDKDNADAEEEVPEEKADDEGMEKDDSQPEKGTHFYI